MDHEPIPVWRGLAHVVLDLGVIVFGRLGRVRPAESGPLPSYWFITSKQSPGGSVDLSSPPHLFECSPSAKRLMGENL